MSQFHEYRYRPVTPAGLYERLWQLHDDHPLPEWLDRPLREALYLGRRLRHALATPRPRDGRDEHGDPIPPRQEIVEPVRLFQAPSLEQVRARFQALHAMNEHLYHGDGSWEPHRYMFLYGAGIPIEEVAFRVLGYLDAYSAFGEPEYLARALEGGRYLLERRVFADGHLRLQGHMVVDLCYTFAGRALLALWRHDPSVEAYRTAALAIGDRLVEHHIAGSLDHAAIPAQLLGPLYRLTGRRRYLDAALKRVLRSAVAFQLPYGGWAGEGSWTWYHAIIARSAMEAYVSTPNTLRYYAKLDRIARCITAALNRMLLAQDAEGRIKMGRGREELDYNYTDYAATFDGERFRPATFTLRDYSGHEELDLLASAYEELGVQQAIPAAHGYARFLLAREAVVRVEFDTHAVGRYAAFLVWLHGRSEQTRRELGIERAEEDPRRD
jgi:hypothetical protein